MLATSISETRRERGLDVLKRLRDMAIRYEFKPGERISEVALADRLGVSRTPVREALSRLATDGLLQVAGRGYTRRPLDIKETIDLYEARVCVERDCMRFAIERASDSSIKALRNFLDESRRVPPDTDIPKLVELDEGFHLQIADMANNSELRRMLLNINERIRFIRWIDMENVGRESTQDEHSAIVAALQKRDSKAAEICLTDHIAWRREQIVESIKQGLAKIYLEHTTA